MRTLLSVNLWVSFLSKLFESVFPPFVVLLVFSWRRRGDFLKGPALRFFLLFLLAVFGLLFVLLFSGTPFEKRYFYTFAALSLVLAAPGLYGLLDLLLPFLKRWPALKDNLEIILIMAIGCICLGKGLNPSFEKSWMQEIAGVIKSSGQKVCLITDSSDGRIAYYAGAQYVRLSSKNEEAAVLKGNSMSELYGYIEGILCERGRGELVGKWIALPGSEPGLLFLKDNIRRIEKQGQKVYVLSFKEDNAFRKSFSEISMPFPLVLVRSFKDEKKRSICLYEVPSK